MARTSLLLAIGLVFLVIALLSLAYPSSREAPEERSQTTESVPGDALQPPATCAPPGGWTARLVQPGDTLGTLAAQARIPVQELIEANCQIADPDRIAIGQQIYLPPASAGRVPPSPTPLPRPFMAEVEWPAQMEIESSSTIRLTLIRGIEGLVPTLEIQAGTASLSTPVDVGTPEARPPGVAGGEYEPYAIARLAGTGLEVQPASPEEQSLTQPRVSWVWTIRPQDPGPHSLEGQVEVEWRPVGGAGAEETQQLWSFQVDVEVLQPPLLGGQVDVLSLLSGFTGFVLILPWLYELYNKRRTQRRRTGRTPPSN